MSGCPRESTENNTSLIEVAIITNGVLPVPPKRGGSVENIIYNIIKANEKYPVCKYTVYTVDDGQMERTRYTVYRRIKPSSIAKFLDRVLYFFIKKIFRVKNHVRYRYIFQRLEFIDKVGKSLNNTSFDKVLIEDSILMLKTITYRDNMKRYQDKVYYHAHSKFSNILNYKKYLSQVKKIIAVSDFIKRYIEDTLHENDVKIETVRNIVDKNLFSNILNEKDREEVRERYGINNNYPVLLFVGRLVPDKGIKELLEALRQVEREDYNLLIVGSNYFSLDIKTSFERELKNIAEEIKGNVYFTGYVPYEEIYQCYQIADLCILPSVYEEPCGLTMLECILSGTPLITTNTGGTPENIVESTVVLDTDYLVERLVQQLDKYLTDPYELSRFKIAAKRDSIKSESIWEYYRRFIRAIDIDDRYLWNC